MEPTDIQTPHKCTYEQVAGALEQIRQDYPQDEVVQAVFPRLINNINRYGRHHDHPFLSGDGVYFNLRLALARQSVIEKVFYPRAALRYLSRGLFGGKDPRYKHAKEVLKEKGLADLARDVASSYQPPHK